MKTNPMARLAGLGLLTCGALALPAAAALPDNCRIVQISAGASHLLALRGDGVVLAWGENGRGQLGTGVASAGGPAIVEVPGLPPIKQVAAGGDHSLALAVDGSAWSWGGNSRGQLSQGTTIDSPGPRKVFDIGTVEQIAAGNTHSLFLIVGGTMKAAGSNDVGELGVSPVTYYGGGETIALPVLTLTSVIEIGAGDKVSMALRADGSVWSWGYTATTTPRQVMGMPYTTRIATGGRHLLALQENGVLWAWGDNSAGEIGDGSTQTRPDPVAIAVTDVVSLAGGLYHSLAVRADGTVLAWGNNQWGQLGDGSNLSSPTAVVAGGPGTAVSAVAGHYASYALTDEGRILAWGSNLGGALGLPSFDRSSLPILVPSERGRTVIAAAATHTIAGSPSAPTSGWGSNLFGQLGDGTTSSASGTVTIAGLPDVAAIAAGGEHNVAARADGSLWTWGRNTQGQLGNGTTQNGLTPARVSGPEGVTAVAAGSMHTLAIDRQGRVWTWGANTYGQLGIGTSGPAAGSRFPVLVNIASGAVAVGIAAGEDHSLAVFSDGTLYAWGGNARGQLGDGTSTSSALPLQILGLNDVTAVGAGSYHSLAVRRNGTLWAWGSNTAGQLGVGRTTAQELVPTQVNGLPAMRAVAGGLWHSLALADSGSVWAWGSNSFGQLGDGTTLDASVPVKVVGVSGVQRIAAGAMHSAAVIGLGRVRTWGENSYGQLGAAGLRVVTLPTQVGPDAAAPAIGNLLLAARRASDVVIDFSDAMWGTVRLYRDPAKEQLGLTEASAELTASPVVDAGAILRGGSEYYVLRGLSACSLTPGP